MPINIGLDTLRRVLEASPSRVIDRVRVDIFTRPKGGVAIRIYDDTLAEHELIEAILASGSPARLTDVDPGP